MLGLRVAVDVESLCVLREQRSVVRIDGAMLCRIEFQYAFAFKALNFEIKDANLVCSLLSVGAIGGCHLD